VFEVEWAATGGRIDILTPRVRVRGLFQSDPYYYADVGWRDLQIRVSSCEALFSAVSSFW
jgi:hypothetical protein